MDRWFVLLWYRHNITDVSTSHHHGYRSEWFVSASIEGSNAPQQSQVDRSLHLFLNRPSAWKVNVAEPALAETEDTFTDYECIHTSQAVKLHLSFRLS